MSRRDAELALAAKTKLSPKQAMELVTAVAQETKGTGMALTMRLKVDRVGDSRVSLSIFALHNKIAELEAQARVSGGQTTLIVGGLKNYRVSRGLLGTQVAAMPMHKKFLEALRVRLSRADQSATISVGIPDQSWRQFEV